MAFNRKSEAMTIGQTEARMFAPHSKQSRERLPTLVILYLLAVVVPVHFSLGSLGMTGLRLLLLLVIVPLSVNLILGKYGRILWTDLLFFLHILWATVALSVNNPQHVVENIGSTAIEFIGGYVVARAYIRTTDQFAALCRFLVGVVCFSLPFAILETMSGDPVIVQMIRKLPGITSVFINDYGPRMGLFRVQGTFAHPILYGLFCSTAFSLAFVGLKPLVGTFTRLFVVLCVSVCVFLSLSSGAVLSVVLQIGLILWAWLFRDVPIRWLLLFGLLIFFYVVVDLLSNRSPIEVFMSYATFSPHNAYWRALIFEWGMKNVWESPIFGIGLNDWFRPSFMYTSSVDNFWLLNAMRYGFPGFLFLAIGYLLALWRVGTANLHNDNVLLHLRRAWMFTFIGLTFTLSTVHVWASMYSYVFFLLGSGMWFIYVKPEYNAGDERPPKDEPNIALHRLRAPRYTRFPKGDEK